MKIYDKYLELKNLNKNKLYLFKSGNFYIFLADDADKINEYMVLKKTPYNKEIMKCGFPVNSIDSYMKVFNNHKLDIEVIDSIDVNSPNIIDLIKKIDLDNITPIKALNFLYDIKDNIK